MSSQRSPRRRRLSLVLGVVLVLALAGLVVFVVAVMPATPPDTEFFVLNESGSADYPEQVAPGEPVTVHVTVENHEYEQVEYRLVVEGEGQTYSEREFPLSDAYRWTIPVTMSFDSPGSKRVDFVLYRDGGSDPYRELYLQFDVTANATG